MEGKKYFRPPGLVLGKKTPADVAVELWLAMSKKEKAAFERYCKKLPKVKSLGVIGYLELIVALSAADAL